MAYNQRFETIISLMSRTRSLSVAELSASLGVSKVTVRKYLEALENQGIVLRTRGGAMMAEDRTSLRTIAMRERNPPDEAGAIAREAATILSDGDTVYLDAGITCRLLAREIRGMTLTVLTNSLDAMNELSEAEGITLISTGGSFRREARAFIGSAASEAIEEFRIGTCFLGASGFTLDGMFYTQNLAESQLKKRVLGVSKRRVVVAAAGKCGLEAFSVFARPGDIDLLVTDGSFGQAEALASKGIEVLKAPLARGSPL